MKKCATISPYIRRRSVIYDFATAPFWISLYCMWGKFDFLFDQYTVLKQASEQYTASIKFSFDNLTTALKIINIEYCTYVGSFFSYYNDIQNRHCKTTVTPMPPKLTARRLIFLFRKGFGTEFRAFRGIFFVLRNWQPYYGAISSVNGN